MESHPSYAVPLATAPHPQERRLLCLLLTLLVLVLASYWIPITEPRPWQQGGTLADALLNIRSLLFDPAGRTLVFERAPIVRAMLLLPLSVGSTMLLALVALRVPARWITGLLVGLSTLVVGLSGWMSVSVDQMRMLWSPTMNVPGLYVGLVTSLAAWGTAVVVCFRRTRAGIPPQRP